MITAALSGCVSWKRTPQPQPAIEQLRTRPQAARVHTKDGTVITFRVPVLQRDSIIEGDRQFGSGRPVAIADVAQVETRQLRPGRILLVGVGGFVLSIALLLVLVPWGIGFG